ncbi:hypothetical protein HED49_08295 [Ochrobactrum daejeonense]|nr:hypothetical protein [Brucella daejeonensis]
MARTPFGALLEEAEAAFIAGTTRAGGTPCGWRTGPWRRFGPRPIRSSSSWQDFEGCESCGLA